MQQNNNVDQAEIEKFSKMADEWWNPFGPCKPLHEINPLRLAFIEKYCSLSGKQILDIGCGGGILTESLAKAGGQVTGMDLSQEALAVAQAHALAENLAITYRHCAVEELAKNSPNHFDVITCMEMLEHVPDPGAVIRSAAKLLKPNGHAFFSTINRNPKSYVYAIIGAEYLLKLLPKGTHDYQRFLKPFEMFEMLQGAGLYMSNIAGMQYEFISKSYRLSSDVSVNYLIHSYKDIADPHPLTKPNCSHA